MAEKIIQISDLNVGYDDKPHILTGVCLDVYENDFLGIIGPNGGGKTTLLKAILGLIKPSAGKISFLHKGVVIENMNIGYLPQLNQIDKKFPISVLDVVLSGLRPKRKLISKYTSDQKDKATEIVAQVGLSKYLNTSIGSLSGGQLQRALLGRAIVDSPDLLILDEPNSYVDKRFESDFYKLLTVINQNTAIILVSHDIGTTISQVKNIACVNGGLHYHAGTDISKEWMQKHYSSCPIEILAHGDFPHRVLGNHDNCDCCK